MTSGRDAKRFAPRPRPVRFAPVHADRLRTIESRPLESRPTFIDSIMTFPDIAKIDKAPESIFSCMPMGNYACAPSTRQSPINASKPIFAYSPNKPSFEINCKIFLIRPTQNRKLDYNEVSRIDSSESKNQPLPIKELNHVQI